MELLENIFSNIVSDAATRYSEFYGTITMIVITIIYAAIYVILAPVLPALTAGLLAHRFGRNAGTWGILGIFIGWVAVIILAFIPDLSIKFSGSAESDISLQDPSTWLCSCGCSNQHNRYHCINCGKDKPH